MVSPVDEVADRVFPLDGFGDGHPLGKDHHVEWLRGAFDLGSKVAVQVLGVLFSVAAFPPVEAQRGTIHHLLVNHQRLAFARGDTPQELGHVVVDQGVANQPHLDAGSRSEESGGDNNGDHILLDAPDAVRVTTGFWLPSPPRSRRSRGAPSPRRRARLVAPKPRWSGGSPPRSGAA